MNEHEDNMVIDYRIARIARIYGFTLTQTESIQSVADDIAEEACHAGVQSERLRGATK